MRSGVTRETRPGETRVAATPETVTKLIGLGYDVLVERGAGELSSFADEAYAASGAALGSATEAWDSDVVLTVNAPSDVDRLRPGTILVSLLAPALNEDLV